jgi:hypothetical protein
LSLSSETPVSKFAFKLNLHRYSMGGGGGALRGSALRQSSAAANRRYNKFTD